MVNQHLFLKCGAASPKQLQFHLNYISDTNLSQRHIEVV